MCDFVAKVDAFLEPAVSRDPAVGDQVLVPGVILAISNGTALVEIHRPVVPNTTVPVQCGVLQLNETKEGLDIASSQDQPASDPQVTPDA